MNTKTRYPLQAQRAKTFKTLREVAQEVRISRAAVSRWEHCRSEPTRRFRRRYAAALGVSIRVLGALVYEGGAR